MTRSVRVLRRAQQDFASCYGYIAERSPPGAESWFNCFTEARDRLAIDADLRGLASESRFVDYEIREVLFKTRHGRPYRILFTVVGDDVLILRVRGPGQDFVTGEGLPDSPATR